MPSLLIPFLSLFTPHLPRAVPCFTAPLTAGSTPQPGSYKEAFPVSSWGESANPLLCASKPLRLLPKGDAEALGRCVSHRVCGCCCRRGYERQAPEVIAVATAGHRRGAWTEPAGDSLSVLCFGLCSNLSLSLSWVLNSHKNVFFKTHHRRLSCDLD